MPTLDQSDGVLDTWAMHSHHLCSQIKPQTAIPLRFSVVSLLAKFVSKMAIEEEKS